LRDKGVRVWFDKWELKAGDQLLPRLSEAYAAPGILGPVSRPR
jgi:hypothetical protein